jgi:hypothetical protein
MSDARLREAEPPPRDAAAGCGVRRLWKSLGSDIVQNRTVARSERFELPTLGFEVLLHLNNISELAARCCNRVVASNAGPVATRRAGETGYLLPRADRRPSPRKGGRRRHRSSGSCCAPSGFEWPSGFCRPQSTATRKRAVEREGSYRTQFERIHVTLKNEGFVGIWGDFVWTVT